jgi:hypothetical protein
MRCCLCLREGTLEHPVTIRTEHVGGKGDVQMAQCVDRKVCWERWNKAHQLVKAGVR